MQFILAVKKNDLSINNLFFFFFSSLHIVSDFDTNVFFFLSCWALIYNNKSFASYTVAHVDVIPWEDNFELKTDSNGTILFYLPVDEKLIK